LDQGHTRALQRADLCQAADTWFQVEFVDDQVLLALGSCLQIWAKGPKLFKQDMISRYFDRPNLVSKPRTGVKEKKRKQ